MPAPRILGLLVTGAIAAGAALIVGFSRSNEQPPPLKSSDRADGAGFVMGRDFDDLLANPNVHLAIERTPGSVTFTWTSESDARLDEVAAMGAHMQETKARLEQRRELRLDDHELAWRDPCTP